MSAQKDTIETFFDVRETIDELYQQRGKGNVYTHDGKLIKAIESAIVNLKAYIGEPVTICDRCGGLGSTYFIGCVGPHREDGWPPSHDSRERLLPVPGMEQHA